MRRRWVWWAPVAVAATSAVSVGLAASLSIGSSNLTPYRTCILTASTKTSTAVFDTTVKEDAVSNNFGTAATMDVQTRTGAKDHRLYVRFDLTKCSPTIPSTATVSVATMRVWVNTVPSACRTYDAFKVASTWGETTINWTNQPFGTTDNNPASNLASAAATLGTTPCGVTAAGYVSWNVTTDVAAFVHGTSSNFGWMVRDDVELNATQITGTFATKDAATANLIQTPQLVVTYR